MSIQMNRSASLVTISTPPHTIDGAGNHLFLLTVLDPVTGLLQKRLMFTLLADGVTWLDPTGAAIAAPPPALAALATATTNYDTRAAQCWAAPGVQALIQNFI